MDQSVSPPPDEQADDTEFATVATAATVEPPSRITVWPFSIRPAVSLAMRLFSSLRRTLSTA